MKFAAKISVLGIATGLVAGELDPRVLRLIKPDATLIYSIDAERHRNFALAELDPLWLPGVSQEDAKRISRVTVSGDRDVADSSLAVFEGAFSLLWSVSPREERDGASGSFRVALLNNSLGIAGSPETLQAATERWRAADDPISDIATKAKEVSRSYDNWFVVLMPLETLDQSNKTAEKMHGDLYKDMPRPASPKHLGGLLKMIDEIRGGVRLGAVHEFSFEVLVKTVEDASGLAAIARWLPGLSELEESERLFSKKTIAKLAENLVVRVSGRTLTISFSIADKAIAEAIKTWFEEQDKLQLWWRESERKWREQRAVN